MSISAEAVASHGSCGNDIVTVPERGRIDVVTRSLIVKVGTLNTRRQRKSVYCTFDGKINDEL